MNTKMTNQITFRASDNDKEVIKNKIAESGLNQQNYLLRCALGKEITNTDGIKAIYPELKRQGVNLNQVTKKLNENRYVDYNNDLKHVLNEVEQTWQLLKLYLHGLQ